MEAPTLSKGRLMPRALSTARLLRLDLDLDLDLEQEVEVDSSNSESDEEERNSGTATRIPESGLGINFYDHKGVMKQEVVTEAKADEVLYDALASKVAASPLLSRQSSFRLYHSPSSFNPSLHSPASRSKASPDLDSKPSLVLIDQLLEENYRGQAETFARIASASRTNPHLFSATRSASLPLSNTASFDQTPTRQPTRAASLVSSQRADLQLQDPVKQDQVSLSFSQESKTILKSYRIPPAPSSSTSLIDPSTSPQRSGHCTYGYRILTVPASSPRIARDLRTHKRLRPAVQVDSQQRNSFLYFTAAERQAIADLVHAKTSTCEHHFNCTDCLNLEFSFQENKAMSTSIPPEERQRIINNNRSLRNIKNVSTLSPDSGP
jgi:hypothetical protein